MSSKVGVITGGKSDDEREVNDFYPTPSASVQALIRTGVLDSFKTFRDPCAGRGNITEVVRQNIKYSNVYGEDLIDYNGPNYIETGVDFLKSEPYNVDVIITNPPYRKDVLMPFVSKCLEEANSVVAMFLKMTFLESTSRKKFFDNNKTLRYILPFSNRQPLYKNGEVVKGKSNAIMYAWFLWDKTYNGNPQVVLLDNSDLVKENKEKGLY